VKCPKCKGKGKIVTVYLANNFLTWINHPCVLCSGKGEITAQQAVWLFEAEAMYEMRMSIGLCMAEAAEGAGVSVLAWNEAEHGRSDPTPYLRFLARQGAVL
jgi:hypothetical protein